jgi:hypothetical protein
VKRYILSFDVWDKRLDKIARIIGKSRKEGKKWGGEVEEKEMRRLVISGNHYIRQGYSGFKIKGIAKLWVDETGKDWILHLLIKPPPF